MKIKGFKIVFLVFALIVVYLVVGAIAPFIRYTKITEEDMAGMYTLGDFSDGAAADRAMLLEQNADALTQRLRLFSMAKEDIVLTTFDMRDGESTRDLAAMLYQKAEEGVHVRILVDGLNTVIHMEGKEVFYALASHPNIEIKSYNELNLLKPWMTQGRMHDKYVIVDNVAYLTGGRNTFDYFLGDYEEASRSLDREVLIYNSLWQEEQEAGVYVNASGVRDMEIVPGSMERSSLYELRDYFEELWASGLCTYFHEDEALAEKKGVQEMIAEFTYRCLTLNDRNPGVWETPDYEACTVETQGVLLIKGETGIYGKKPLVFYQLMRLMADAEKGVVIHTPYVVCNDVMYEELTALAERIPVEMVINSVANGDNICASSDYLYHKKEILETGVELYEYDGGNSSHGKSIVIDGEISIIGSYNMDLRSTYMDTELMVAVKSPALTEELSGYMSALLSDSRHVLTVDTYEDPEGHEPQTLPEWKKIMMYLFGFIEQAFRFEI